MRTPGGARVPDDVRNALLAREVRDPQSDHRSRDPIFENGFHAAITWEQVARLQQLSAASAARRSTGPKAWADYTCDLRISSVAFRAKSTYLMFTACNSLVN